MAEIANNSIFSQTDSSNVGSLPGISGSSAPSQIDDSIRALIGAVKREHDWRNYSVTSSGSANAYVVTYAVAPAAYYTGQRFAFITNFAVTGSATVNVNSLGAKTIKKMVAGVKTNLASGDIASGDFIDLDYDGTDMVWVNKGFATSVSVADTTTQGIVELATTTEQLTGTDATRAATPDSVASLWEKAADVASASTVTFGDGGYFHITGTTTITALACTTDKAGRSIRVRFAGVLTLTHNATSLILPTGANITTAADDTAEFVSEGSGNFRCLSYQRANGSALTTASASGVMTFIGSGVVVGTATADHTSIGVFSSYLIRSTTYNTAGGTRTFQILFSSNNGSSFSTARNVATAPATSVSTATGSATVSGVGASATNKVVTPKYVTVDDVDTTPVVSTYTTTDTETVVNGVINAVRFTHNGAAVTTSYEIYGVA